VVVLPSRVMLNIIALLIILTLFGGSNKFNHQDLLKLTRNVRSEYAITNKFSKFQHDFNKPKIVRIDRRSKSKDIFKQIKSARFGVYLKYVDDDEPEKFVDRYQTMLQKNFKNHKEIHTDEEDDSDEDEINSDEYSFESD
jgi:hypothetical protein